MKTHLCPKCYKEKQVGDFRKEYSAGPLEIWNLRYCKDCMKEEFRQRKADPDAYSKMKSSSRNWKYEHPKEHARLAIEYRKRHPEKIIAQNRLNYAIKRGRIKRQPCEKCGTTDRIHAHHVSYEPKDWYNVHWLCFSCHALEHEAILTK